MQNARAEQKAHTGEYSTRPPNIMLYNHMTQAIPAPSMLLPSAVTSTPIARCRGDMSSQRGFDEDLKESLVGLCTPGDQVSESGVHLLTPP